MLAVRRAVSARNVALRAGRGGRAFRASQAARCSAEEAEGAGGEEAAAGAGKEGGEEEPRMAEDHPRYGIFGEKWRKEMRKLAASGNTAVDPETLPEAMRNRIFGEEVHSYMDSDFDMDPFRQAEEPESYFVSSQVQDKMWTRFKSDPASWSIAKLSQFYGLPRSQVIGVLTLKRVEEERKAAGEGYAPEIQNLLDSALQQDMPEVLRYEEPDPAEKLPPVRVPIEDDFHVDEEFLDKLMPKLRGARGGGRRRRLHGPLPKVEDTASGAAGLKRWKLGVKDISPSEDGAQRLMWVRDPDGALRHSTVEEERYRSWTARRGHFGWHVYDLERARDEAMANTASSNSRAVSSGPKRKKK